MVGPADLLQTTKALLTYQGYLANVGTGHVTGGERILPSERPSGTLAHLFTVRIKSLTWVELSGSNR
jgi:hypothetical protein